MLVFVVWLQWILLPLTDLRSSTALARAQRVDHRRVSNVDVSPGADVLDADQCAGQSSHWRSPADIPRSWTPTHFSVSVWYRAFEAVALQHTSIGLQINLKQGFSSFSPSATSSLSLSSNFVAGHLILNGPIRARDGSGPGNFVLTRIELRAPSAHRLAGKASLMELQLWHETVGAGGGAEVPRAQDSNSTVISILFDPQPGGPIQPFLARLRDTFEVPLPPSSTRFISPGSMEPMDLNSLLKNGTGLRYEGSEIAPPCRRGVVWLVSDQAVSVEEGLLKRLAFHLRIASQLPLASRSWPLGQRSLLRLEVHNLTPNAASNPPWSRQAAWTAAMTAGCLVVIRSWLNAAIGG